MSPVRMARNAISSMSEQVRWRDLVVSFFANVGAMAALLLLIWALFSGKAMDSVTDVLKEELGTEEILKTAERNAIKVDNLTAKVDAYVAEMRELFPVKISNINYKLSRVAPGCRQFKECKAIYFVQRYKAWLHCDAPVVLRHIVVDYDGVEHPVVPGENNRSQRVGSTLARVIIGFIPDDQIRPGLAFFAMLLQFKCGDQFVEQMTELLPFDLLPPERQP